MAATEAARRLTEAHRLAQAKLGARSSLAVRASWRMMDPNALDATFQRWLSVVQPIITGQRALSAKMAAEYLSAYKKLELGAGVALDPVLADAIAVSQVATSMTVTGPVSVKAAMTRGVAVDQAMETASVNVARSGLRLVLGGGRETVTRTTGADREAQGWARATSGKPCAFCAMLASRGPVYTADSVHFHAHDGCHCTAEPVYRADSAWPPGAEHYASLWSEAVRADGDTEAVFAELVAA